MSLTPLTDALQLHPSRAVAFVGAGGKTTAIWRLSDEAAKHNRRVIIAPTTHILEPRLPIDSIAYLTPAPQPDRLRQLLGSAPRLIIAAGRGEIADFDTSDEFPPARPIKLNPLEPTTIDRLYQADVSANWLIEADGARRHLLKAPAEHEPAIPRCVETVIIVTSLEAINQPLNETIVHRWEIFAQLSAAQRDQPITAELVASVMLHARGGYKNIPPTARVCVLLTQLDSNKLQPAATPLADLLLAGGRIERVVIASLRAGNPIFLTRTIDRPPTSGIRSIAAIILAAGESKRFGDQAKQLFNWRGRSFVQIAVDTAIEAGFAPVIVVIGSHAAEVRSNLANRKVTIIENADWNHGQSTSVRTGLLALPENARAALFMPIDQPNLTTMILRDLTAHYLSTGKPIVTASVRGKRTTPVLFDRSLFADILAVEGDRGARELIDRDPARVEKVEVDADSAVDIDTLDDYNRLIKKE